MKTTRFGDDRGDMSKPSDDQLSPGHTEAIGRLVVGVSKVDILLTDLIAVFLRTDSVSAAAAVHHQQVANKIDTLRTLVKLRHWPDGDPEILELLSKVKGVNDYRNTIVHGHWVVDKAAGETYVVRFKTRGEFKSPRSAVTCQQILLQAQQTDKLADELGALRDRLWNLNEAKRLSEARHLVKAQRRFEDQILNEITVTTRLSKNASSRRRRSSTDPQSHPPQRPNESSE